MYVLLLWVLPVRRLGAGSKTRPHAPPCHLDGTSVAQKIQDRVFHGPPSPSVWPTIRPRVRNARLERTVCITSGVCICTVAWPSKLDSTCSCCGCQACCACGAGTATMDATNSHHVRGLDNEWFSVPLVLSGSARFRPRAARLQQSSAIRLRLTTPSSPWDQDQGVVTKCVVVGAVFPVFWLGCHVLPQKSSNPNAVRSLGWHFDFKTSAYTVGHTMPKESVRSRPGHPSTCS